MMYLAFYLSAVANLQEIYDIFVQARWLSPELLITVLITTAAAMIPVRLFLASAVVLDHEHLWQKFTRLFPVLVTLDTVWALSPLLLVHHISTGLALGMSAALLFHLPSAHSF